MIQRLKDYLVRLGPRSFIVQLALKLQGMRKGFATTFRNGPISLRQGQQEMILAEKDFYLLPFMMEFFGQAFQDIEPKVKDGIEILDFSGPGSHRYRKW